MRKTEIWLADESPENSELKVPMPDGALYYWMRSHGLTMEIVPENRDAC